MPRLSAIASAAALATLIAATGCEGVADADPVVQETSGSPDLQLIADHGWDPLPPAYADGTVLVAQLSGDLFDGIQEVEFVLDEGVWHQDTAGPELRAELSACSGDSAEQLTWDSMPRILVQSGGWAYVLRPVYSLHGTWQGDAFPTAAPSGACSSALDELGLSLPVHPSLYVAATYLP